MKHYTPSGWVDDAGAEMSWATEEHLIEVKRRLSATDGNFLISVVQSLAWQLKNASAAITGIYCDQWYGVTASGQHHDNGVIPLPLAEEPFITFIQCDEPEHGIAATWLAFVDKFGLQDES